MNAKISMVTASAQHRENLMGRKHVNAKRERTYQHVRQAIQKNRVAMERASRQEIERYLDSLDNLRVNTTGGDYGYQSAR